MRTSRVAAIGLLGTIFAGGTAAGCGDDAVPDDPCAIGVPVDSVQAAVDTVEALREASPDPLTLDCFLASLARPLGLELTSDVFSTQPAEGIRSPRILIRGASLTMTVVPVGEAIRLLELGEVHPSGMTVKAELEFPIDGPIAPEDPYLRTLAAPGATETGCRVCHFDEIAVGDGRYANTPLRPPDNLVVPLEVLLHEREICDPAEDPARCSMFAAVLDHGEVYDAPSPTTVATQFGPAP
ncbi:MAG: hypothetical protein ABMB14_25910 [Myxococcota bacterium]